jgi:DHA2 family multidrug resistance protein
MSGVVRGVITLCVVLATLMQSLDSTIANVALPYMQGSLSASQDEINWVLTSYMVAAAIMTAPTGFLAARFGRTRLFVAAVAGFTLASVACGMAQSLDQIVLFRLLQGICGAALVPLSQSVLFDIYPVERRAFAIGLWVLGANIGPVLGPVLGGWLTEDLSWRWVFYINVPIGIATVLGLFVFLKETPFSTRTRLDWVGFGALALGIGAFQLMLNRGETLDWFSAHEIIVEACLAGLGLFIFLVQTVLAPKPFLSPRLFADINFVLGNFFISITALILYASLALLAPYLQNLLNYPVITAGLVLAPRGAGVMFATLVCGRLLRTLSARSVVGIGLIMIAYTLYQMIFWTPDISAGSIVDTGLVQGFALGLVYVPLSTITFSTLASDLRTEGAGVYALTRNIGSALGISVTSAILQRNTQINHASIAAGISPFNRALQAGAAARFWNPSLQAGAASLNAEITRQAQIIAYLDNFRLMFILTVICLPLVLLFRSSKIAPQSTEPVFE